MKKIFGIVMVMVMAMTLVFTTGCTVESNVTTTKTETHTKVCSQEEMTEKTGISLEAPNGADEIQYAYCEGDENYAQAKFTFDGATYVYRAQFTNATDFRTCKDGTVPEETEDLENAVSEGDNIGIALAGDEIDTAFNEGSFIQIQDRDGLFLKNEDGAGMVTWLDVAPGILYTMTVDQNCDQDKLVEMADSCFAPMQGEAE